MTVDVESRRLGRKLRWRGTVVLAVFALLWAAAGASSVTSGPGVLVVRLVAVIMTGAAIWLAVRLARSPDADERPRVLPDGWNRRVGLVNLAEIVGIAVAVVVLLAMDAAAFVPAVVCLIVGLHFFPLARAFDQAQYLWTAVGLCVAAVAGIAVAAGDGEASRTLVGFGAAAVLWATALHVGLRG